MKEITAFSTDYLLIHSGPGLESCDKEEGIFEVRTTKEVRQFERIAGAILFYYPLEEEASLWDMSDEPLLIEEKIAVPVSNSIREEVLSRFQSLSTNAEREGCEHVPKHRPLSGPIRYTRSGASYYFPDQENPQVVVTRQGDNYELVYPEYDNCNIVVPAETIQQENTEIDNYGLLHVATIIGMRKLLAGEQPPVQGTTGTNTDHL